MSKSGEVYDLIVNRLINAEYRFGDRLLVRELGAETGASRQPIMSSINRLSAEGFVHIIPQVGCEVINPSHDEIEDFFRFFGLLEGLLSDLAARRRTDENLRELKLAQQRLTIMLESPDASPQLYLAHNRAFHQQLHEMAHSPLLARKQRNNFNMSDFFITQSVGFGVLMSEGVREHDRIIRALETRNADRSRAEAEAHIAAIASTVLRKLKEKAQA